MRDICIKLEKKYKPWNPEYQTELEVYVKWIKENIPEDHYHIPRGDNAYIYFLEEEDLLAFTIKFGHIYKRGRPSGLTKVEKMILHETSLEKYHEKSNN
jgi:hypothetical protein